MELRQLGNSGLRVHPIGMGCWAYGGGSYWGAQSQKDVNAVVSVALDHGANLFDTAEMYNGGKSEIALGHALGKRRREAVILTKISPQNCRKGLIEAHCDASLKRLGTDYIDCYVIHWPFHRHSLEHLTDRPELLEPIDPGEAFFALNRLVEAGKIRAVGVSNFGIKQLEEAFACGAKLCVNEITYNLLSRAIEKEILPFCIDHHISVVGSMTLQQGLLAGIYNSPDKVPLAQAHSKHFAAFRGGGQSRHHGSGVEKELFEALDGIKQIASEQRLDIAQLSIAWALSKRGIAAALVGSRRLSDLQSNLGAGEIILDQTVINRLEQLTQPVLDKLGYCADYYEDDERSRIF